MKKLAALIALAACLAAPLAAAEPSLPPAGLYPPIDAGAEDPSFASFRAQLLLAAARRDVEGVVSRSDEKIHLSFGGDVGRATLRQFLREDPGLWAELIDALRNGASAMDAEGYSAPYWFALEPAAPYEPFETVFIPQWDAPIYASPSADAERVATLSYGYAVLIEPYGAIDGFRRIRLASGVEGYAAEAMLRSPVGYRAGFERRDGDWAMTFFIAGD